MPKINIMKNSSVGCRQSAGQAFPRTRGGANRLFFLSAAAALALMLAAPEEAAGRMLGREEIGTAAANFLSRDELARELLPGRQVASLEPKGTLWIAVLEPSGHLVLAGSDRAEPIIGFSEDDYAEPAAESPGAALLAAKAAEMDALEADGTAERNARWNELLQKGKGASAKDSGVAVPAGAVLVKPLLRSHYNQWQPYNDYTPVYDGTGEGVYRGRDPSGCVPTAAAQVLRHFRWPAIAGGTRTVAHEWYDNNKAFKIRFDGRVPFDWDALADDYAYYSGGYDLRGKMAEVVRYPISRLVLWADSLGKVHYGSGGSGANYGTIAGNLDEWYQPGESLDPWTDDLSGVVANLKRGIPVPVGLVGHEVVGDGWAETKGKRYVHLNFGWGGQSDGWYNLAESADGMAFEDFRVDHFPRAKAQMAPLPAVTGTDATLSWFFPDLHAASLAGFQVTVRESAPQPKTLAENFTAPSGTISGSGVTVGENGDYAFDGALLAMKPNQNGAYTFATTMVLSGASVLSFKLRGDYAMDSGFRAEIRLDNGSWQMVSSPSLPDTGDTGWKNISVNLGKYGGRSAQVRLRNQSGGGTYYPSGGIYVDNVRLTEVLPYDESRKIKVAASARSVKLGGLKPGASCSARVVPVLSKKALAPAEASEPIEWNVAGTAKVPLPGGAGSGVTWSSVVRKALGTPAVTSVLAAGGASLQEGFFRECARGRSVFYVKCSPGVVSLRALPSHLTLVPDSAVAVHAAGGNWFAVELDASRVGRDANRSRMILTLEATDSNGTVACKDLSLRFSSGTAADAPWNGSMICTVQFDGNGGTASRKSRKVAIGKAIGALPTAKRDGYALVGWYTAKSGGTKVDATTKVPGSRTYYARWAKAQYKVAFNANGGTGNMAAQVFTYGKPAKLRVNAFKRTGCTFLGWATSKTGAVAYKNAAEVKNLRTDGKTTTLYAKWAKTAYKVAFNANGGGGKMAAQAMTYGKAATLRKNAFKRTGYTFAGWAKTKTGAVAYKNAASVKNLRADGGTQTLFARWAPTTYKVAFNANGGTGTMAAQSVKYDATATLRKNAFKRTGYTFAGWAKTRTGAVAFKNAATVKNLRANGGTQTLFAKWTPTTYKVAFNANGGTGTMAAQGVKYDAAASLRKNAFKRTGYTFSGWAKTKTGAVAYKNAASVKNLRADGGTQTLFAKWMPTTYKVAFNANGGTGTMAAQGIQYDATASLRANAFTRDGFTFQGWSKTATGAVAYADAASVKNLRNDGGTATLYAVWTENPEAETSSGVPYAWLKEKAAGILSANGGDYEAAAAAKAANGVNTVWECYVAGLDPTDGNAAFTAALSFDGDGNPVVSSDPDLGDERTYTVEGVENLGDAWGPTNAATRFFRVKVALP
jgi:uncharacterized repeat protein (TIGR02543 family)